MYWSPYDEQCDGCQREPAPRTLKTQAVFSSSGNMTRTDPFVERSEQQGCGNLRCGTHYIVVLPLEFPAIYMYVVAIIAYHVVTCTLCPYQIHFCLLTLYIHFLHVNSGNPPAPPTRRVPGQNVGNLSGYVKKSRT